VCVLRVTYKKDGTVDYEATDPPRTLTLHGLLPCIMSDCSVCFAIVSIFLEVPKVIMCMNSNMKLYSFWGYLNLRQD